MRNKLWLKIALILCLVTLLTVVVAGCGGTKAPEPAKKEVIRLTVGSANTVESVPWTYNLDKFLVPEISKRVAEKTKYEIQWNKAYGGSVAKTGEELQSVQQGLVDLSLCVFPYEAARLPLHNFTYWVTFGPKDPMLLASTVKQLFKEFPIMYEVFEKNYSCKLIGLMPIQNYELVTKVPISKLSDLKGRKIAAVGPNLHFLSGSGAVPVQSVIPEMYTCFQTGVYEGWVMYPDSVLGSKIYEVAPYFNKGVDFGAILLGGVLINSNSLAKLPPEVQAIILEVGNEMVDVMAKYAVDTTESQLAEWVKRGGKINDFSAEARNQWAAQLPDVINPKIAEVEAKGLPAKAFMKRYFEILKEKGYTPPKVFEIK